MTNNQYKKTKHNPNDPQQGREDGKEDRSYNQRWDEKTTNKNKHKAEQPT